MQASRSAELRDFRVGRLTLIGHIPTFFDEAIDAEMGRKCPILQLSAVKRDPRRYTVYGRRGGRAFAKSRPG